MSDGGMMKIDEDVMMNDWWMVTVRTAFCKDSAKRVQDKMKSRRIYIFHAELQPIFAK